MLKLARCVPAEMPEPNACYDVFVTILGNTTRNAEKIGHPIFRLQDHANCHSPILGKLNEPWLSFSLVGSQQVKVVQNKTN